MKRIGLMATYPARRQSLCKTLPNVMPGLNELHLYCNEYSEQEFSELKEWVQYHIDSMYGNLTVTLYHGPSLMGDIRDMGKFYGWKGQRGFIFLLDDDLQYPDNYYEQHMEAVHLHNCVSTVHGRQITRQPLSRYFSDTKSYHYRNGLGRGVEVDIAGTGTVAFSTLDVRLPRLTKDIAEQYKGMADIWFALQLKKLKTPIRCIPRPQGWLSDNPIANAETALYYEALENSQQICNELNQEDWHA